MFHIFEIILNMGMVYLIWDLLLDNCHTVHHCPLLHVFEPFLSIPSAKCAVKYRGCQEGNTRNIMVINHWSSHKNQIAISTPRCERASNCFRLFV